MHPIQAITGNHQLRKPKQTQKPPVLRVMLQREGGKEKGMRERGFFSKERPGIWGEWSCRTDPFMGLMGLMGLMAAVGARLQERG